MLCRHVHAHEPLGTSPLRLAEGLVGYLAARARKNVAAKGKAWWQNMLNQEYGGMGEAAYRLHAIARGAAASELRNAKQAAEDAAGLPHMGGGVAPEYLLNLAGGGGRAVARARLHSIA